MSSMESLLSQAWEEYSKQALNGSALNATLEDLWHKIAQMEAPTTEEEDARLEICADLSERLAELGSRMGGTLEAEAHGSFLMGCYTSSSTLEVAVTGKLPGSAGPHAVVDVELRSPAERLNLLERVHALIADCGIAAQGTVNINRAARVPSVSFEHASSGIPVRLCIAYPNFALRPHVVRGLAMLDPRLRGLIQLVELWADAHGLNNPAAGTFNSWALINLVIFAAQTFQQQPLLPPLWRVCGAPDPAAPGAAGAATGPASSSGGAAAPAGSSGGAAGTGGGGMGAGGATSTGGANPLTVRPTQRVSGLTASSEGLAPVLKDIMSRLAGPADALGMPAGTSGASQSSAGLMSLFHWFLVLLDRLLAAWQLSWNRRWRVSTWWGQLVQQPFNRAFLVPVECPFDPADNAAKSLGCENQPKHQQVLRAVVAEVAASLRLLQGTQSPEDLDRLILGMFGLEVEHLYLEEAAEEDDEEVGEGEEVGEEAVALEVENNEMVFDEAADVAAGAGDVDPDAAGSGELPAGAADAGQSLKCEQQQEGGSDAPCGAHDQRPDVAATLAQPAVSSTTPAAPAAARGAVSSSSSPASQVRLLQAGEAARLAERGAGSPASVASLADRPPRGSGGKPKGKAKNKAVAAAGVSQVDRASADVAAAAAAPPAGAAGSQSAKALQDEGPSTSDPGLGFDVEAVQVGADDVDDGARAAGAPVAAGSGRRRAAAAAAAAAAAGAAAAESPPPLPTSSAAAVTAASPAVLRANAMVQRPLSPLLRDVTNARQYGRHSGQSGPAVPKALHPSAASTSAASSATESPGGESLLPFEALFGSFLEGARRLFDNMAQGMAELSEDLNELAATTAATIRAVINDDEDLPFLSSSSAALRRQRRQRLQLLHRGGGGAAGATAAAAAGASPASSSQHQRTPPSSSRAAKASPAVQQQGQQPRPSPLRTPGTSGGAGTPAARRVVASPGAQGRSPAAVKSKPGGAKAGPGPSASPAPATRQSVKAGGPTSGDASGGTTPARGVKGRGEQVAAALVTAASETTPVLPLSPLPARAPDEAAADGLGDGLLVVTEAGRTIPQQQQHPVGDTVATAAERCTEDCTVTAVQASLSGPLNLTASDAPSGVVAAGSPVMLQPVPVSASEHPLACSPLTAIAQPTETAADVKEQTGEAAPQMVADAVGAGTDAAAATLPDAGPATTPFAGATAAAAEAADPSCSAGSSGGGAVDTDAAPTIDAPAAAAATAPASSAVPLAVGLLRLGSGCDIGAASTCGTSLTRASTPTADITASTASSPTVASNRSFAPTPPRKGAGGGPPPALPRATTEPAPVLAAASGGLGGAKRIAPPPPPPLPPPPRPPMGMGGLRVKSATFRKGAAREALAGITSPTASSAASGAPGSCPPVISTATNSTSTATTTATSTTTGAPPPPPTTTTTTTMTTAATTTRPAPDPVPRPAVAVAVAAAAAAAARSFNSGASASAAAAAADAALLDPAARTVIQLSSGRLQELAECIDRAGPGTTIDLQGVTFAGTLAAPSMKVTAPALWLTNGALELSPEQQLVFAAKGARMMDVTVRDRDGGPGSAGGAPASGAPATRPALLVTKQSYIGGGNLALTRCELLLGSSSRGVGLQVKGKGCSASLESCLVRGSAVAVAQASDATLALSRCTLELGAGQGLCCRENATVTATDCQLRCFGGACAAVLAGGCLELSGCKLSGADGRRACGDRQGSEGDGSVGNDDNAVEAAARDGAGDAVTAGGGPGVLAEGKGSSLVARVSSFAGFRSQAALVVTAGASASLEECRATNCLQGAMVGTRGGRLMAARCELSSHAAHGLSIGEGATADLRDCRLHTNGEGGLRVGGIGSMAVLRGCELSRNAGSGVVVAAGGCANLDGCTASGNGCVVTAIRSSGGGGGGAAREEDDAQGRGVREGHGLRVEGSGARATALRCIFSGNADSGVKVGAHGSVQLLGCGIHCNGRNGNGNHPPEESGQPAAEAAGVLAVEVDVEAHGSAVLSRGCSWGRRSAGGGDGDAVRPGGPDAALRVAGSASLELSDNA